MKKNKRKLPWWSEEYGFFGSFYMQGDNSKEGYLVKIKQSLKQRTASEVKGIVKLLALPVGAKILDCPCGYGRHSIGLAKKKFVVTGSDINSIHLKKARKEARGKGLRVKFVRENMIDIKYKNKFDAVINVFYSFGFFETDRENERVLKNFFKALKNQGKFLMHTDVNIPRIISGKYKTHEQRNLQDGKKLIISDKYDPGTKRIYGTWIIREKSGKETKKNYSMRLYTKEEFIKLCKKVGFKKCKAYSDWTGKKYSKNSEDMIIVAEK